MLAPDHGAIDQGHIKYTGDGTQQSYKEHIMPQPKASTTNKTRKASEEQELTRLVEEIIETL